jgi:hypothetical protein
MHRAGVFIHNLHLLTWETVEKSVETIFRAGD